MNQPINDYTIGSQDLTSLMQTTDMQRHGYAHYTLLNATNSGVPGVCAGSRFDINGSLYYVSADTIAQYRSAANTYIDISNAPVGGYSILAVANGSQLTICAASVSSTTISYNESFGNWYETGTQNLFLGAFNVSVQGSSYIAKWTPDKNINTVLQPVYANGAYNLNVNQLQNFYNPNIVTTINLPCSVTSTAKAGYPGNVSVCISSGFAVNYPCTLANFTVAGTTNNPPDGANITLEFRKIINGIECHPIEKIPVTGAVVTSQIPYFYNITPGSYNVYLNVQMISVFDTATITNVQFLITDVIGCNTGAY